jgi:cobyrinic acid a,c-diamide synthase
MVPPEQALTLFYKATQETDIAIIEGVMGVFDGFSYDHEEGSSAQIAKLLGSPVLLVLDVGKMARSAGAVAFGYTNFDPGLKIAGFILNRCGSDHHYQGVKLAVETATHLPVVGWLPKDANLHIPERHLGLVPTDERGELTGFIAHAATVIEQYFDLERILNIAASYKNENSPISLPLVRGQNRKPKPVVTIGVARDAAFSFYYEDNLDLLREAGAEIVFFSPQTDSDLPPGLAGLYFGGGFPELHAAQLAANSSLKKAIRQAYAANMPIYAECGGFMYLTETMIDLEGRSHAMVGLAPGLTRMQPRLTSLGYRLVESPTGNFLLPKGCATRGHEFHWSSWERPANLVAAPAWHIRSRRDLISVEPDGYAAKNLVASYIHLHFAHHPQLAQNFVKACRQWKNESQPFI